MRDEFNTDVVDEAFPLYMELLGGGTGQSFGVELGGDGQSFGTELGGTSAERVQMGIYRTLAKARDNRRPAPPMRAMPVNAPRERSLKDQSLIGMCGGSGEDLLPLTASLLKQFGESGEPRIVRIDTVESYKQFRVQDSPELSALKDRVSALQQRLTEHEADPDAHSPTPSGFHEELAELDQLGSMVADMAQAKQVPLRMPRHFDGLVEAWHQGGLVGASLVLPGADGTPRICTCMEPINKGALEAAKAATEAGVPDSQIIDFLPAIGAALSAATAIKETASGVESILQRSEAKGTKPFLCRLEPKTSPAIYTLAALARMCSSGHQQACDEWQHLAAAGPPPIRQAMAEVLQVLKTPMTTQIGGTNEEGWLGHLWSQILEFFGMGKPAAAGKSPATAADSKSLPAKPADASVKPADAPAKTPQVGWY